LTLPDSSDDISCDVSDNTATEMPDAEGDNSSPIVSVSLRSLLQNLGGHENFSQYQAWFRALYCDTSRPVFDVLGRRVQFDTEPTLDDCAHVCYGGLPGQPYNPDEWKQHRAVRIAWIEYALKQPNKVHPDRIHPDRHKYLLYVAADDPRDSPDFYCVIVRVLNSKTVAFLTAYGVEQKIFQEYGSVGPRLYPVPKPKKKRR
jgi:hypothetical protein